MASSSIAQKSSRTRASTPSRSVSEGRLLYHRFGSTSVAQRIHWSDNEEECSESREEFEATMAIRKGHLKVVVLKKADKFPLEMMVSQLLKTYSIAASV
ncbi:unnamed protein product [Caenorhabditis brenneri]